MTDARSVAKARTERGVRNIYVSSLSGAYPFALDPNHEDSVAAAGGE
jgi:hypothetical protein